MAQRKITILGAGVTGITTAILLQESGFSTTICSPLRADRDNDTAQRPEFASIYPAACILPHSVDGEDILDLFSQSQSVFARLANIPQSGIRWQDHYELDASPGVNLPGYTRALAECRPFDGTRHLPFDRIVGRQLFGWVARVLFAEMPLYFRYLFRRYLLSGGRIVQQEVHPDELGLIPADLIVNCTGLWARSLFHDLRVHPVRGWLMVTRQTPVPPHPGWFSYNYKPPDSEYPFDLYFFPRQSAGTDCGPGWLLGGTRETGQYGADGTWQFTSKGIGIDAIPAAISDLNRTILKGLTGVDILSFERQCYFGFRPARAGGIRLDVSNEGPVPVIHNYGHGGAGVALSWGCALRVTRMVRSL